MIPSPDGPVRVACLGDLHVREQHEAPYRDLFAELNAAAHVVVLCGDLTDFGKTREAEILAEDLRVLTVPVVAVLGNHDYECGQPEEVRRILGEAGVRLLDGGEAYEIYGVGFGGAKGCMGGFGRFLLSSFGEPELKAFVQASVEETLKLETSLRSLRTDRAMAVLHYAPVPDTLVGEPPEIFPFLGSSRLAEVIDRFENIRYVVHGHAHRGALRGRTPRGVPVLNCARPLVMAECGRPYLVVEL